MAFQSVLHLAAVFLLSELCLFNVGKLRTVEKVVVVVVGAVVDNGSLHMLSTGTTDTQVAGVYVAAVFSASWIVVGVFYLKGMG